MTLAMIMIIMIMDTPLIVHEFPALEPRTKKTMTALPKIDVFDAHNFDLDIHVDEHQVH
jgi:hypothetical protein